MALLQPQFFVLRQHQYFDPQEHRLNRLEAAVGITPPTQGTVPILKHTLFAKHFLHLSIPAVPSLCPALSRTSPTQLPKVTTSTAAAAAATTAGPARLAQARSSMLTRVHRMYKRERPGLPGRSGLLMAGS